MAELPTKVPKIRLRSFYGFNPVKGLRFLEPNNVRDRILSNEETGRLFAAAAGTADFIRPLFHMLFNTGMRLGEALALEWVLTNLNHLSSQKNDIRYLTQLG